MCHAQHTAQTSSDINSIAPLGGVATMPLMIDSEQDHFYIVTIVSGVMWFVGYAGMISEEDFAYACQGHAKGAIVTVPGATTTSYAFKCTAVGLSLFIHVLILGVAGW